MTEENRDLETESKGPERDADAGPVTAEDGDGGTAEEPERERFPVQEDLALKYVADNKYAYGPRLSKVDMEWSVLAAESVPGGIVRVTIEFRPSGPFRGTTGSEYVDVNEDGVVLARRQLRIPKENWPWVLIGLAVFLRLGGGCPRPLHTHQKRLSRPALRPGADALDAGGEASGSGRGPLQGPGHCRQSTRLGDRARQFR